MPDARQQLQLAILKKRVKNVSDNTADQQMSCMEVWGGNTSTDSFMDRPGLSCRVWSQSFGTGDAGGDVYYLSSCASGRLTRFLLADVCGHGESAAEGAKALRELMRRNINRIRQTQLVQAVNRELVVADMAGRFATALIGTWFAPTSEIVLSNAGHPIPLLYKASTSEWSTCGSKLRKRVAMQNMPLGIDERTGYTEHRVKLQPGDLLLCYTDALSESQDSSGNYVQTTGLVDILQSLNGVSPNDLIERLLERLESASPGNLGRDDVTIMLFEATTRRVPLADSLLAPWRFLQNLFVDRVKTTGPRHPSTTDNSNSSPSSCHSRKQAFDRFVVREVSV